MPKSKSGRSCKQKKTVDLPPVEPVMEEETLVQEEETLVQEEETLVQEEEVIDQEENVEQPDEQQEEEITLQPKKRKDKERKFVDNTTYHKSYRTSEKWKEYITNYNQVHKQRINELKKNASKQKQELKLLMKTLISNQQVKFENQDMLNNILTLLKMNISSEDTNKLIF
jgi:hypothetical protein